MTDSVSKIARGLAAGEGYVTKHKSNEPPRLADIVGAGGTLSDLKNLKSTVVANHSAVESIRMGTVAHLEQQTAAIRAKYDREGWAEGDKPGHRIDEIGPQARKNMTDRALAKMRREAAAINSEKLTTHMTAIRQARVTLDKMKGLFSDPVKVLLRETIGSTRRAVLYDNLAHAGPDEVAEYGELALRQRDREMAAAVLMRIDSLPERSRKMLTITKADIAKPLMAETMRTATALIGLIEVHADMSEMAVLEANGQKVTALDRVKLGRRMQDLESELGSSFADLDDKPTVVVDTSKSAPIKTNGTGTSEFERKWADYNELLAAHSAGDYDKARALDAKWGFDLFDDAEGADASAGAESASA